MWSGTMTSVVSMHAGKKVNIIVFHVQFNTVVGVPVAQCLFEGLL